jgi:hypothetical protein
MIGPDDAGRERLQRYFEEGFDDLFLTEVRSANERDLKMGTFLLAAAFTDALAIAHAGNSNNLSKNWEHFVNRYFPQPDYAILATLYGDFRSRVLHNFSSPRISFIHDSPGWHKPSARPVILNRENFVADVEKAFHAFYHDVQQQPSLASRVLAFLDRCPPLTVMPVQLPTTDEVPSALPVVNLSAAPAKSITGNE